MVKTEISPEDIERAEGYAAKNCLFGTICTLMGWDRQWLDGRIDILTKLRKKKAEFKLAIRESQQKHLNQPVMAIFLGKNELGQTDMRNVQHSLSTKTVADIFAIVSAKRASLPNPVKHIESEVIDV